MKDVRAFLGFTGYYRRFLRNYARIARPLNDLLVGHCTSGKKKKGKFKKERRTPFEWKDAQQEAFETLKEKLTQPPVLAYADYSIPFKLHTDASTTGLGAVLYQNQDGIDKVVSYASRSLRPTERNYPAHKLEFLALKWAITEKFHDYLYGTDFQVVTDNNPLTYVFTTAKLDATGQRWLAELSNYNCTITYRSGKQNGDADGLSRIQEESTTRTVFPDVLKAVCHAITAEEEFQPCINTLTNSDEDITDADEAALVSDEQLQSTALSASDWRGAQSKDACIKFVIDCLLEGRKPTADEAENMMVDRRYVSDWEQYKLIDGVLYKKVVVKKEEVNRLCLPKALQEDIFKAYHDDLGHQGRERTLSLIKRRFFLPGLDQFVKNRVQRCSSCIRRKTAPVKAAELVNITSTAPMELICIDYLSLERSKGGYEKVLVITDHFTRYAQAIPTRNETAQTTAKALYENFFIHYGFPSKIHSDKGASFESKTIRKLCEIAGIKKTRTTPYHPMGNGMVERFNKTLLNMLGTLPKDKKSDWKSYVSTLTHAYNAAVHDSTGYSPYYLMYGRHPRLAIDAFLGLKSSNEIPASRKDYSDKLKDRLEYAYK
ncbi:MAG: RNase H-like domain-containing protein, partial [Candidatus Thiodiazotropha endolucinida]|nr:RNase H-like domain-containing protein [Candidatus Thiodiazotropha endolucinida]